MTSTDDVGWVRELVRVDWVVSRSWNRLHAVDLTEVQLGDVAEDGWVAGRIRLRCGRIAAVVSIPGVFARLGADRCQRCCRVVGMPVGRGSPKNDPACRVVLGLPPG